MNLGKKGFLLNGGGFAGALSVGMLKAMCEAEIFADIIQGVSVGTLSAAKFIESGINGLQEIWLEIERRGPSDVFNWMDIPKTVIGRSNALYYPKGLHRLVDGLNFEKIVHSPIPLQVVVMRESDEQPVIFRTTDPEYKEHPGKFRMPVIASTAIPGIFPPVQKDGVEYSDGIFFQLQQLIDEGCDTIFLFLNDQAPEPNARWDKRLAQARHMLYEKLVIADLKEILRTRKDFQIWTPDDLDLQQKTLPSLVRKMMATEKSIRSAATSAIQGDDINFVPHRIIVLYTETPITSLYMTGFSRGDIKAAINVGYVQAKNILTKVLK